MIVKIHKINDGRKFIAICDEDLINKRFESDGLQLDLTTDFYKGNKLSDMETKDIIKKAYIINVVGEKSINFCINEGVIDKKKVIRIMKIPHAQAILSD